MTLQGGLSYAEGINSAVYDFERLFSRGITERPLSGAAQRPAQRITGRRERPTIALQQITFPFNFLADVIHLCRVAYFEEHLIIAAACFGSYIFDVESRFLRDQLCRGRAIFSQALEIILDLHAHDEMRSAFEIETEMNVVCQIGFESAPGKVLCARAPAVWTNNNIDSHDRDDGDNDRALQQVLLLHNLEELLGFF